MSPAEILWRAKQSAKARLDAKRARPSPLSRDAVALRTKLPVPALPLMIEYFDRSFSWDFSDLPWQGNPELEHLATRHWTAINYRDTAAYGDPKYTWELNRHQFIRKWVIHEASRPQAALAFQLLTTQWIEKNPYGYGINWTSSLELALRLVSWQSALETLSTADHSSFDPQFLSLLHRSVTEHARHLRRYPSLYSSANNHRIGELVGELAAAAMFPDDKELYAAATHAWEVLQNEAKLQVTDDGVSREQASYYHAYVLLYFRRANHYVELLKLPVSDWFTVRIKQMQYFLDAITGSDGQWFEIGDRDDGNLAALLPWTKGSYQGETTFPADGFEVFPLGGYYVYQKDSCHLLFRAGDFGYPSIAAHAHCDQLSVLLKYKGRDILTDSGTYCYHSEDQWRRYFKGTSAHNTVRVDKHDQAGYGGPFLWNSHPNAVMDVMTASAVSASLTVPYPGGTVTHCRTVSLDSAQVGIIQVTDELVSASTSESHTYELIWNLGPGLALAPVNCTEGKRFELFIVPSDSPDQPIVKMNIESNIIADLQIYTGDQAIPAGFYSRNFGEREAITQIRVISTAVNWQATTTISPVQNL